MKKYCILFFFLTTQLFAQKEHSLIKNSYFLPDIEEAYTLQTLLTKEFEKLDNPRISYKNGTYWFKVHINSQVKEGEQIIFHCSEPSVKFIQVYNQENLLSTVYHEKGETTISIPISKQSDTYFFKVFFNKQVHFPITVTQPAIFYATKRYNYLKFGLYYGFVLMTLIVNLYFYYSLKDRTFLYYCFFLASINIGFTGFEGSIYLLFSQSNIDTFLMFSHFLVPVTGSFFAASFLNLEKHFPIKHKIGQWLLIIPFCCYLLFLYTNNFLFYAFGDIAGMLILAHYWVLGLLMIKKENYALFFVVGYSLVLVAGFFYLAPLNFGLPFISISLNQLKFGALFEMLILTYAITYRVKKLYIENQNIHADLKTYISQVVLLEDKIKRQHQTKNSTSSLEDKIMSIAKKHNLTERESDVLLQITNGLSNQQIADLLFVSINTIKYHTRNLYEKLNIKKRGEVSSKLLQS